MLQETVLPLVPTGIRALIADDHEDSARGLEMMLRMIGFETQIALDGIDALRKAKTFKPMLLLIDINMPKLDGFYTCGVIRVQPWAQQARVVAVTGYHDKNIETRSKEAGFDAFLLKPVDFSVLIRVIGEMLFQGNDVKTIL